MVEYVDDHETAYPAVDSGSVRRYVRARELAESEGITFREALQRVTTDDTATAEKE